MKEFPRKAFFEKALAIPTAKVSAEQLLALQAAGKVLLIDLRSPVAFSMQHLKGAVNLPATDLTDKKLHALAPDKSQAIVVYCDLRHGT